MKNNDELLQEIMTRLDSISYIKSKDIPNIDLYMDQVTTFMNEHLKKAKRNPDDIALTKTMINNYAKNRLLPAPIRKKYSREHMILLLFIYYYKNLLSFHDIEQILAPIIDRYYPGGDGLTLTDIYEDVFSLERAQMDRLKEDVAIKFEASQSIFTDVDEDDRELLQLFAFISELSFDVYLKKQIVENLIDQISNERSISAGHGKSHPAKNPVVKKEKGT